MYHHMQNKFQIKVSHIRREKNENPKYLENLKYLQNQERLWMGGKNFLIETENPTLLIIGLKN